MSAVGTAAGFYLIEDTLSPALILAPELLMEEVEQIAEHFAPEILSYAKENAPWQDITGDARAGLEIEVAKDLDEVIITLYHTVDYGLWLEVIQSGKFATIMPTLEHYAHEVFTATHAIQTGEDLGSYE